MAFETNNILKSFLKKSGIWTAAKIIQALITFLIFYLYAFYLSKVDYGNYQKIFVLVGFLSGILSFGIPTFIPALPIEELNATLRNLFRKACWLISASGIAFFAMVYLILPQFSFLDKTLTIILALLNALNLIYELYALKRSHDRFVFRINIIISAIYFATHLVMLLSYNLSLLLLFLVCLALVRMTIFYGYYGTIGKKKEPHLAFDKKYFSQWIYVVVNEAFDVLSKHIDKIVLIWLLSASDFAVYFNGSYEIPLLGMLVGTAGTFINLQTTQHALGNLEIRNIFFTITLLLATIVFPLFFFARLYAFPLFSWLFDNKYNEAVTFFLIYAWVIPLRINNYTAILLEKMKSHLIVAGNVSAVLVKIILMIILYQVNGVTGIAIACVAGTFYQVLFYLFHIAKALSVPISEVLPFKKLSVIFLFSLTLNLAFYLYLKDTSLRFQIFGGTTIALLNAYLVFQFYVRKQINI